MATLQYHETKLLLQLRPDRNMYSLSSSLRLELFSQPLSTFWTSFDFALFRLFSSMFLSDDLSFSSLLLPNLAQFLVTNLVSFLTHDRSMSTFMLTRYFFAFATIWAVFPTLKIVLTFQHPIRMLFVGVANDAFGEQAPSWFWPMHMTLSASHLTKSSSGVWHVTVLLPR